MGSYEYDLITLREGISRFNPCFSGLWVLTYGKSRLYYTMTIEFQSLF